MGLVRLFRRLLIRSLVSALLILFLGGWGSLGHRVINSSATIHLPQSMLGLIQRSKMLGDSASVADNRKNYDPNEGPKHFMDVDDYPEFTTKSITKNLDSLVLQYGSTRVYKNGISPWAARLAMDSLTQQMRIGDWMKAWRTAADLGHYVGDINQPLHNAKNYDGQLTGNSGIHSRYESSMLSVYQNLLIIQPRPVSYVADPIDYLFGLVYQSQTSVDSIIAADNYAKMTSGWNGTGNPGTAYYDALWLKCGSLTILQLQKATESFANLLYSAWINAGSPAIPIVNDVRRVEEIGPREILLQQNYPNPFNPTTRIAVRIPHTGYALLTVDALDGRRMATLMEGEMPTGSYEFTLDAGKNSLTSGTYLYRLETRSPTGTTIQSKKMILLK